MNFPRSLLFPRRGILAAAAVPLLLPALSRAQDPSGLPPAASAVMHEVSPGIYEIGKVRINQASQTLTFPCAVNMQSGALEYLLVTPAGNAHESLLVAANVEPRDLHLAMLLLGSKGSGSHPSP